MKKRTVSLVLAAIILFSAVLSTAASATELPVIPLIDHPAGDANYDGYVNALDVIAIMRYIVGKNKGSFSKTCADYDGNKTINSKDVLMLMLDLANGEFDD